LALPNMVKGGGKGDEKWQGYENLKLEGKIKYASIKNVKRVGSQGFQGPQVI